VVVGNKNMQRVDVVMGSCCTYFESWMFLFFFVMGFDGFGLLTYTYVTVAGGAEESKRPISSSHVSAIFERFDSLYIPLLMNSTYAPLTWK